MQVTLAVLAILPAAMAVPGRIRYVRRQDGGPPPSLTSAGKAALVISTTTGVPPAASTGDTSAVGPTPTAITDSFPPTDTTVSSVTVIVTATPTETAGPTGTESLTEPLTNTVTGTETATISEPPTGTKTATSEPGTANTETATETVTKPPTGTAHTESATETVTEPPTGTKSATETVTEPPTGTESATGTITEPLTNTETATGTVTEPSVVTETTVEPSVGTETNTGAPVSPPTGTNIPPPVSPPSGTNIPPPGSPPSGTNFPPVLLPSGIPVPPTVPGSGPIPTINPSAVCVPPQYQCHFDTSSNLWGWDVCTTQFRWTNGGSCKRGEVCVYNALSRSPYCVPAGFQFPATGGPSNTGNCQPGKFRCAFNSLGHSDWSIQSCGGNGKWHFFSDCGAGHVCTYSPVSGHPFCKASGGGGGSTVCFPGTYQCAFDSSKGGWGWQVCNVAGTWVWGGNCASGQTCSFNNLNGSPYCL